MIQVKATNGVVIAGMRGCGKTTMARHILSQIDRKAIYDPLAQYTDMGSYVPTTFDIKEFDNFCAYYYQQGNYFIAVEECENWIGQSGKVSTSMMQIINMGRNKGIGYMLITRRLANVNKTGLALSDHIFLFRMRLPNDIEYCEDLLGSKDDAAMLPKLANYEYLYMDSESNVKKCHPLRLKT